MKYAYARCSTNSNLQDITRQHRELIKMGVDKKNIFSEYESGTKADRPQFIKLKETVKEKDTIICTEASRITRSMKQLIDFMEFSKEKHLKLILGSFIVDFSASVPDPMTLAMIELMGVFSELEKNIISERVKSGMANAKAKGKQIGRKIVTVDDIPEKFIKYYQLYNNLIN